MATRNTSTWSPADLHRLLNEGARFSILDVRNRDEFEASQIEGREPIRTLNIPYFDLIDLQDENEAPAAAVMRAAPDRLKGKLPKRDSILVVCAEGKASAQVAEGLRRLDYQAVNLEGGMAGWGNHYEVRAVEESSRVSVLQISRPARGCLSYMLASGGDTMVVDPARHTGIYTRIAEERGWHIKGAIDTHLQADHLSGATALTKRLHVDHWMHPYDSIHPDDLLPAKFSFRYLEDELVIPLGEVNIHVLHLPGHTLGMVNLRVDGRYLLTGDTLFIDSIGRPDLGGRAKTWAPLLYHSLQRLLSLPGHSVVLPAHFSHMHEADDHGCYCASIAALKSGNEGLRMLSRGLPAFTAYILRSLPVHPQSYDEIRRVNTGLIRVDEAKAGELELGRNRCALSHHERERLAA